MSVSNKTCSVDGRRGRRNHLSPLSITTYLILTSIKEPMQSECAGLQLSSTNAHSPASPGAFCSVTSIKTVSRMREPWQSPHGLAAVYEVFKIQGFCVNPSHTAGILWPQGTLIKGNSTWGRSRREATAANTNHIGCPTRKSLWRSAWGY